MLEATAPGAATTSAAPQSSTAITKDQAKDGVSTRPYPVPTRKATAPLEDLTSLASELDASATPTKIHFYEVQYDKYGLPKTLLDWRREPRDDNHTAL